MGCHVFLQEIFLTQGSNSTLIYLCIGSLALAPPGKPHSLDSLLAVLQFGMVLMETSGAFPCGASWGSLIDWGLARTANLYHMSGSQISPRARVACTLKACELCSCPALRPETERKSPEMAMGHLQFLRWGILHKGSGSNNPPSVEEGRRDMPAVSFSTPGRRRLPFIGAN